MDSFRALPKLNEKLEEMVSSGEARLATVVASYGNEVEVIVTGGAKARFPSTHYGSPVGSSGALISTLGGGRLFIPMGVSIPVPFNGADIGQVTTTSISAYHYFTMATLTLPAGTYQIYSHAVAPFTRSVATGAMQALMRIGTSESDPRGMDMASGWGPISAYEFITIGLFHSAVVVSNGTPITVDIGFRGLNTAGTTFTRRPSLWGTYQMIG